MVECRQQSVRTGPPRGRFFLQHALYDVLQSRRHFAWPNGVDRGQLLRLLLEDDVKQRFTLPRALASKHLPRHQSQTVDIGARIGGGAIDLLRRHVRGRPNRRARHRQA